MIGTTNDIMYGNDLIGEVIPGKMLNEVPQVVIKRNPCSMIGIWNVRTLLQTGKRENLKIEMKRLKIDILGISEMKWKGQGDFISGDYRVIYSDGNNERNGVGIILNTKWAQCVRNHIAYDDRLIMIKLKSVPNDIAIIQVYMPITQTSDDEVEEINEKVEEFINLTNGKENLITMDDWMVIVGENAHGKEVGKYGLRIRNERGDRILYKTYSL